LFCRGQIVGGIWVRCGIGVALLGGDTTDEEARLL
jgi:hypothetical protein